MRYGGGFRFLAALLVLGVVAALTAGAYGAGFVAGAGTNSAGNSPWIYGGFLGAGNVIGLIVTILILVVIFRIMAFAFFGFGHRRWDRGPGWAGGPDMPAAAGDPGDWHRGRHHGWHGGWHEGPWQSARQAAFDDWHRRAHETPSAPGGTPNGPTGPAAG